jgi:NADPH:quinone reductase-like Zn-dependent oxidoreductase
MRRIDIMTITNTPTDATSTSGDDAENTSLQDRMVTMTALAQHRYGSADTLAVEQVSLPEVGDNDVLIEVVAAGIDRGVCHLMTGTPYLIRVAGFGLLKPKNPVLGMDVAGRVAAVGSAVGRFAVGDEVMGVAKGSFAQYAVADRGKLAFKPAELSFEQAGASTISGITALQALTTVGRIEAGQSVLVIGASGGVGSFAVQIAKAHGAIVTGVASAAKLDFVTSLGADAVVDYAATPLANLDQQFDLIIDVGGRTPLRKLRRILAGRGTHVIVGGEDGGRFTGGIGRNVRAVLWSMFIKQRLTFFISSESRTYIDPLVEMLANGQVIAAIGQRSTLVDAPDAIRVIERGGAVGKTVIDVSASGGDR